MTAIPRERLRMAHKNSMLSSPTLSNYIGPTPSNHFVAHLQPRYPRGGSKACFYLRPTAGTFRPTDNRKRS